MTDAATDGSDANSTDANLTQPTGTGVGSAGDADTAPPAGGEGHSDVVSHLDSLINANTGLGMASVDPSQTTSANYDEMSDEKLEEIFLEFDLAKIVTSEPALEITRNGWEIKDPDNEDKTAFGEKFDIDTKIRDAIIESSIYGGSLFAVVSSKDPSEPLVPGEGVENVVMLSKHRVSVDEWETDIRKKGEFDTPRMYEYTTRNGGSQKLHGTRARRFFGYRLTKSLERRFSGWGQSRLEVAWDAIKRLDTAEASLETSLHRAASLIVKIAGLEENDDTEEARRAVRRRLQTLIQRISTNRATAVSNKEDVQWISPRLSGMIDAWQTLASAASRAARMPKTILFGDTPAGLSTSDETGIDSWHKRLGRLGKEQVIPALRLLYKAEFGDLEDWTFSMLPFEEESELEKAKKRQAVAQTDALYIDRGVRDPDQVAESRDGPEGWSMETEVRADLQQSESEKMSKRKKSKKQSILDKLQDVQLSLGRGDQGDIPKGPYSSPPEELTAFLQQSGISKPNEAAFEYVEMYNKVYRETKTHSKAREAAFGAVFGGSRRDVFSGPDDDALPDYVKEENKSIREQWVEIWNERFDETDDEAEAFRAANSVLENR